jgi:hypothetical protein
MKIGKSAIKIDRIVNFLSILIHPQRVRTISLGDVDQDKIDIVEPFFVLSTGRCGTKWLTELLRNDCRIHVNHNDYPELLRQSRLAFEYYEKDPHLFQEVLRAARDGYLLDSYRRGLIYVETNHRITFLAHAIRTVYPRAKFIHLVRHPGRFVQSGIRLHWYSGTYYDLCRPRILDNTIWDSMTDIEKLAWLWNVTNQYVENLKGKLIDTDSMLQVRAEDMFSSEDVAFRVCDFVGAHIRKNHIKSMLKRRINRQLGGYFLPYESWSREMRDQLRRHALLSNSYGYEIRE